jgi:hypothetical protein
MNNISDDCLLIVFDFLDLQHQIIATGVSKRWQTLMSYKMAMDKKKYRRTELYIHSFLSKMPARRYKWASSVDHIRFTGSEPERQMTVHVNTGSKRQTVEGISTWFMKHSSGELKIVFTSRVGPRVTANFKRRWVRKYNFAN